MTETINRRTVLAGTTALAALGPLPVRAAEVDGEVVRLYAAFVDAERHDREALSAYDVVRYQSGTGKLKAAADAAYEARVDAWRAFAEAPAKTITGIALKLEALFQWDHDLQTAWRGKCGRTLGDTMFFGARADALRLAGMPASRMIDGPYDRNAQSS